MDLKRSCPKKLTFFRFSDVELVRNFISFKPRPHNRSDVQRDFMISRDGTLMYFTFLKTTVLGAGETGSCTKHSLSDLLPIIFCLSTVCFQGS